MSKHTISDIAQRAGVGIATASRALNNAPDVSPNTRARVLAVANELGYRPNAIARRLQGRRAATIAYIPDTGERPAADMWFKGFITILAERCASHSLDLLIHPAGGERTYSADFDELIASGRADGLIIADTRVADERVASLAAQRLPFVVFGRSDCPLPYAFVDVDGEAGTRAATEHLLGRGHRRIAFLGLPRCYAYASHRLAGYRAALAARELASDPTLIVNDIEDETMARAAVRSLLATPDPPTAIVAASDLLAIYALHTAAAAGYQVGRDLALVGFDDLPLAAHTWPPLTTVRQNFTQICDLLIQSLQEVIAGNNDPPPQALVKPELIVRETS